MNKLLTIAVVIILLNTFFLLYQALKGPSVQDRIIGINIVGTKTLAVLVLISYVFRSNLYLDIAIVYAFLNLVAVIGVSRYLETHGSEGD
jgi:multicomponent Na+:H+ antiporter subunit F